MLKSIKIILCIIILLSTGNIFAQPNWYYTNTGANHIILIQSSISIEIDGVQIVTGDYLGVFYDSLGTLACAGYTMYDNSSNMTIAAWGSEAGTTNGFEAGEEFKWKIWQASDNQVYNADADYMPTFPHSQFYWLNGTSGLSTLYAYSPVAPKPDWEYYTTSQIHKIEIPDSIPVLINDSSIQEGDYIGVFYDSLGIIKCCGFLDYNGITDTIFVYGSPPYGIQQNDEFVFKVWQKNENREILAIAVFLISSSLDSSHFVSGGLSILNGLTAFTGADIKIEELVNPVSACESLDSLEAISIRFSNIGDSAINNISFNYTINNNPVVTSVFDSIISFNESRTFDFPTTENLSDTGTYSIKIWLSHPSDDNKSNDSLSTLVYNYPVPDLNFVNLDSVYCPDSTLKIILKAEPSGGVFFGEAVLDSAFFPSVTGNYNVFYNYTNPDNLCQNQISKTIRVFDKITIELGDNIFACEDSLITIFAPDSFSSYNWSSGLGNNYFANIINSGIYYLTVIDSNGCTTDDFIEVTYVDYPDIDLIGASEACSGDTVKLNVESGHQSYSWSVDGYTNSPIAGATETGMYYVSVGDYTCFSYDSIYIHFHPKSVVTISGNENACKGESVMLDAGEGYFYYAWNYSTSISPQVIEVNFSDTFWVTVIDSNGCYASDSIIVTIHPVPIINLPEPEPACVGDTIEILSDKADYYLWNTGSTEKMIQINKSGKYSVTVSNLYCENSDEIFAHFVETPKANFDYEQYLNQVQFINNSSISNKYTWNFDDGSISEYTNPFHLFSDTGIYNVSLSLSNICGYDSETKTIHITDTNCISLIKSIEIQPNPCKDFLITDIYSFTEMEIEIILYNNTGIKQIERKSQLRYGNNRIILNIENYISGIYFLSLYYDKQQAIKKVVITE